MRKHIKPVIQVAGRRPSERRKERQGHLHPFCQSLFPQQLQKQKVQAQCRTGPSKIQSSLKPLRKAELQAFHPCIPRRPSSESQKRVLGELGSSTAKQAATPHATCFLWLASSFRPRKHRPDLSGRRWLCSDLSTAFYRERGGKGDGHLCSQDLTRRGLSCDQKMGKRAFL